MPREEGIPFRLSRPKQSKSSARLGLDRKENEIAFKLHDLILPDLIGKTKVVWVERTLYSKENTSFSCALKMCLEEHSYGPCYKVEANNVDGTNSPIRDLQNGINPQCNGHTLQG
jgi:hypothetical protein